LVADYVAQLAVSLVLAWSPHRIAIGGGVGTACGMLEAVRSAFTRALGSYGVGPAPRAEDFIVRPVLADAGLEGALLMAAQAEI
jgi:fructokinase